MFVKDEKYVYLSKFDNKLKYENIYIPTYFENGDVLKIKENGVLAGMEVAEGVFRYKEADIVFEPHKAIADAVGEPATLK